MGPLVMDIVCLLVTAFSQHVPAVFAAELSTSSAIGYLLLPFQACLVLLMIMVFPCHLLHWSRSKLGKRTPVHCRGTGFSWRSS